MGKIIFISPDDKLTAKAKQVVYELGEDINVVQGSLSEGVRLAKQAVKQGTNIVISRGGTGNLIKMNLQIPVVSVEINGFDIVRSISKAMRYSNHIGVVGFENLVKSAEKMNEKMEKAFPIQIYTAMIENERQVDQKVLQLLSKGVEVFIGGNAVIQAANKYGCNSMLVESGKEAIVEAIREAKHILEVQLKEKEKSEFLKSIIDFAYDGIIGIDAEGKIMAFNPVAAKLTGHTSDEVIGKHVDDIVENSNMLHVLRTGVSELEELQYIGDVSVIINRIPIIVNDEVRGVVATFQELERIQKIERQTRKKMFLKGHIAKTHFNHIIGKSKAIRQVKMRAREFAQVDSTVLILGETGTGKELFAQSIHNASHRADKPFVAINCAALPENLLESELFGYVEGAFTGARKGGKPGVFELAHSGTIFLDEISEMSPKLQARFLRVIQEREVVRIGDDKVVPVDVRVIAATNRELYRMVRESSFREDLYYRLNVLELKLPPLRDRKEDIIDIARFFVEEKSKELGMKNISISKGALNKLTLYPWPGNVRQLENIIERAIVLCSGSEIGANIIEEELNRLETYDYDKTVSNDTDVEVDKGLLKNVEEDMILKVLKETGGNRTLAAKRLGISTTTLWRRLKQLKDDQEDKQLM
jgi:PAS domain S-box-containing protein